MKVNLPTVIVGEHKAVFSIATRHGIEEDAASSPGLLHFTLDLYHIMQSFKQGGTTRPGIGPWSPGFW